MSQEIVGRAPKGNRTKNSVDVTVQAGQQETKRSQSQKISERHCLAIGLRLGKVGATVAKSGLVGTTFTAVEGWPDHATSGS